MPCGPAVPQPFCSSHVIILTYEGEMRGRLLRVIFPRWRTHSAGQASVSTGERRMTPRSVHASNPSNVLFVERRAKDCSTILVVRQPWTESRDGLRDQPRSDLECLRVLFGVNLILNAVPSRVNPTVLPRWILRKNYITSINKQINDPRKQEIISCLLTYIGSRVGHPG